MIIIIPAVAVARPTNIIRPIQERRSEVVRRKHMYVSTSHPKQTVQSPASDYNKTQGLYADDDDDDEKEDFIIFLQKMINQMISIFRLHFSSIIIFVTLQSLFVSIVRYYHRVPTTTCCS